jgi:hypothetical protein
MIENNVDENLVTDQQLADDLHEAERELNLNVVDPGESLA